MQTLTWTADDRAATIHSMERGWVAIIAAVALSMAHAPLQRLVELADPSEENRARHVCKAPVDDADPILIAPKSVQPYGLKTPGASLAINHGLGAARFPSAPSGAAATRRGPVRSLQSQRVPLRI